MYEFKNLENISFEDITTTWNLAFSDYIVSMEMTPEKMKDYFKVTKVDRSQSFGAFYNDILVGMIINSVDIFKGGMAAFDAMTGIVPEHRGNGIYSILFEQTKNSLKGNGLTAYYLEVITKNENAYNIYKKKGGKIERKFSCLEGNMNKDLFRNAKVNVSSLSMFPKEELSKYEPSYGNRIIALHRNADEYQIAHIEVDNRKSAAIFNKSGQIAQIMYNRTDDRELLYNVLSYLSQNFEKLNISNIPMSETELINELLNVGFKTLVNQYEMLIDL